MAIEKRNALATQSAIYVPLALDELKTAAQRLGENKTMDALTCVHEAEQSIRVGRDDQYSVAGLLATRASALALAGRKEHALAALDALMKSAVPVPTGDLRWSPNWDILRNEPRFRELLATSEAAQTPVKP